MGKKLVVFALWAVVILGAGCGGGDKPDSGCTETCTAQEAGGCGFGTAQECADFCQEIFNAVPRDCQNALAAMSECMLAQPDICDYGDACAAAEAEVDAQCDSGQ